MFVCVRYIDRISPWIINYCCGLLREQSPKGRSNRVEGILNHLMLSRPDEDFVKFCNALTATNQDHVVRQFLSKESIHIQQPRSPSYTGTEQLRLAVQLPANLQDDEWKKLLIKRRSSIVNDLDASGDLIDHLLKCGVMNKATAERCQVGAWTSNAFGICGSRWLAWPNN